MEVLTLKTRTLVSTSELRLEHLDCKPDAKQSSVFLLVFH